MKRTISEEVDQTTSKKPRREDDQADAHTNDEDSPEPFRPSSRRKATDICEYGTDGSGFIQGVVAMRWPTAPDAPLRVVLKSTENGVGVQYEVIFSGPCRDYLQSIKFTIDIADEVQIALKGLDLQKREHPKYLPMVLHYREGAVLRFLKKKNTVKVGMLVDTWSADITSEAGKEQRKKVSNGNAPLQPDWFSTPHDGPVVPPPCAPAVQVELEQTANSTLAKSKSPSPSHLTNPVPTRLSPGSHAIEDSVPGVPSRHPADQEVRSESVSRGPAGTQPAPIKSSSSRSLVESDSGNIKNTTTAEGPKEQLPPGKSIYRTTGTIRNARPSGSRNQTLTSEAPRPTDHDQARNGVVPSGASTLVSKKATKKAARTAKKDNRLTDVDEQAAELINAGAGPSTSAHNEDRPLQGETSRSSPVVTAYSPLPTGPKPVLDSGKSRQHKQPERKGGEPSTSAQPRNSTPNAKPAVLRATSTISPANLQDRDPALDLEAGCVVQGVAYYTPLQDLRESRNCNAIGVVALSNPPIKTQKEEWSRKVYLVDPSNIGDEDAFSSGFVITLFGRTDRNLPQAKPGDVMLLRGFQVSAWHGGFNGMAPSYRPWTWALFDPTTGKTRCGDSALSSSSPSTSRQSPQGASSFQFTPTELQYCIRLGDWWRAVQQQRNESSGEVIHHQIVNAAGQRLHRLIQDASPDAPPNGFFDCTIEVLHGFMNDNRVYSLYVTDYTKNESVTPVHTGWCPPGLGDRVLKIEMWDQAAELAPSIKQGEFYCMANVRMKISGGGYVEATFSEARKMRKLDEDELENEPHLQALLSRKQEWEAEAKAHEDGHGFPHKLFAEATPDSHFKCTVEILYISHKDERAFMYVTDYTARPDLAPISATADWTRNLGAERIVKVQLRDQQAETAKNLNPGDFVALWNLRLIISGRQYLAGRLGGDQRLIHKLTAAGTGNEHLIALIQRKEQWEEEQAQVRQDAERTSRKDRKKGGAIERGEGAHSERKPTVKRPPGAKSIKEVLASTDCPGRFRVVARIVDFYPMQLEDCVILHCTNCDEDIPKVRMICTKCDDDMADTYVRPFYRFFFAIEDEDGDRLHISVSDPKCTLLADLPPADFREDPDALDAFKEQLRPILGELVDDHESFVRERAASGNAVPNTPMLDLTIGSWLVNSSKNERGYILLRHTMFG